MRKFIGRVLPFAVTLAFFLFLYNNVYTGSLVLLILILVNLAIVLVPTKLFSDRRLITAAKPVSLCLVSVLGAVLMLEAVFPSVMPTEYSQIRELTKNLKGDVPVRSSSDILLFANEDQKRPLAINPDKGSENSSTSWHTPGRVFDYYGYEPNTKTHYVNRFHWNSSGYYDHDYTPEKPKGTKRILIVGDSYVEAVQVPLKKTFHKLLELFMNSACSDTGKPNFEVIALGNSGSGQVEHYNVLQKQGITYKPDVVVLALCSNDFCDDDPELKKELVLASGEISPLIRGLARHGYFAMAFALRRLDDLRRNRIGISPELLQWSQSEIPRIETAWVRTLGQIKASRDFCRDRGILFLLVYLGSDLEVKYFLDPDGTIVRLQSMGGSHKNISWDMGKSLKRVSTYCEEHDIPMISLLEPLIAAQKETGNYVFGDHYTMFGHEVAAKVLGCALDFNLLSYKNRERSFQHCLSRDTWAQGSLLNAVARPEGLPQNLVPTSAR